MYEASDAVELTVHCQFSVENIQPVTILFGRPHNRQA